MALTSLSVKVELNEINSSMVVTDLIGNDYNAIYGYTLTDIQGMIKITGFQSGIVYKNPGWDTDDYSSPDIISTAWSKTISNTVPVGQDGLIVKEFYSIEYKVSVDIGVSTFLTFFQVFQNIYERAVIDITSIVSLTDSTFIFTDNTNYVLSLASSYTPTSLVRNFDITWPVGSGIANTVSSSSSVQLGADIWSGHYLCDFTVDLSYLFLNDVNGLTVTVVDEIRDIFHRIAVVYQDFTGLVGDALLQITATYEDYKLYNLPYAENYQQILEDIMMYYDMFKMANISNTDMGYAMTKIYDILTSQEYHLGITVDLKVAEILPNPTTSIYQNFTIVSAQYTATVNDTKTFNIPELVGGTPLLVIRGTQPIFAGTDKDFTYDNTTGDITMTTALSTYESVFLWISKIVV